MTKLKVQVSIMTLCLQIVLIALVLALWRVLPVWREPPPMEPFMRLLCLRALILLAMGTILGAFLGGWVGAWKRGCIVGVVISALLVGTWLLYWYSQCMVAG